MLAKDIKPGTLVVSDGQPCLVKAISVQTPSARGASMIYKYKAVNLISRQKADFTLRGGDSLDEADFQKREVKLMYTDATHAHFLDQQDFNQWSLKLDDVAEEIQFLTEQTEGVRVLIYEDQAVGVEAPLSVELKVTQCDPAARGNSATSRTKPATLETGLVIQVPDYLAEGQTVRIDTRTGTFVARV